MLAVRPVPRTPHSSPNIHNSCQTKDYRESHLTLRPPVARVVLRSCWD